MVKNTGQQKKMTPALLHYNEIQISNVLRWIESNSEWPVQDIDSCDQRGYFITHGRAHPNDEFMILDKRYFDYRYAIKVLFLEKEMMGWIVCGHALYPALKLL